MTSKMLMTLILAASAAPAFAQAAAPAQPPSISRSAFMQRIDGAFTSADANKDGFTDRSEIESAETKVIAAARTRALKEREAAFQKMDGNKDGSLTLTEFNAFAVAEAPPKANATPLLNKLDTNKDGKISLSENRAPALAQFDRADTNKDGSLTVAERKAAAGKR